MPVQAKTPVKRTEGGYNMIGLPSPIMKMRLVPWNDKYDALSEGRFLIAIAAGGGSARTGIANFVKLVTLERDEDDQSLVMKEFLHLDTERRLVTNLAFSPSGERMVLASEGECLYYSLLFSAEAIEPKLLSTFQCEKPCDDCFTTPLFLEEGSLVSGGSDGLLRFWEVSEDAVVPQPPDHSVGEGNAVLDLSRHPSYTNLISVLCSTGIICVVLREKDQAIPLLRVEPPLAGLRPRSAAFINDSDLCALFSSKDPSGGALCHHHLLFESGDIRVAYSQWRGSSRGVLVTLATPLFGDVVGVGTSRGSVAVLELPLLEENSAKDEMHELPPTSGVMYPSDASLSQLGCLVTGSLDGSINVLSVVKDLSSAFKAIGFAAAITVTVISLLVYIVLHAIAS